MGVSSASSCRHYRETQLNDSPDDFFGGDRPTNLVFSTNDLERLSQLRQRQKECPLLMVESSLLPGQTMEMGSADYKFEKFATGLSTESELGIVGFHPYNKAQPLSVGVMVEAQDMTKREGICVLTVKGKECFDLQGQPWWDKENSCFMAHLEISDDDVQSKKLSVKDQQRVEEWHDTVPELMNRWCQLMKSTGRATDFELEERQIPGEQTTLSDQAYYVAALLNPSPPWKSPVCLEIRPALLACRNDYDRLHLVFTALQASLQHIEAAGESKLF